MQILVVVADRVNPFIVKNC